MKNNLSQPKKCLVCHFLATYLFSDQDHIEDKKYAYYRCNNCGLLFIDPLPTKKSLDKIYNLKNNTIERKTNQLLFAFYDNRLLKRVFDQFAIQVNKGRANFVEQNFDAKTRNVFDLGCGVGRFLEEMGSRGWKVWGQELSQDCIVQSRQRLHRFGGVVVDQPIRAIKLPKDVKLVTMWHVFEHLPDFGQILANFANQLPKGGMIVMECPQSEAMSISWFKLASPNFLTPEHITFWTAKSYQELFQQHKLEVIKIEYPRSFLFTTGSAAFKEYSRKFNNRYLGLVMAILYLLVSLPIYLMFNKSNEAIRVAVIKR